MKKLKDYTDKEIESLTKMDLKTLIIRNTIKVYRALDVMKKHELVKLAKSLKK